MHKELSCSQIKAILNFYVEGSLNKVLQKLVKRHLETCPECMADFMCLIEEYNKNIPEEPVYELYASKQYDDFKKNLSAYIDNELDDNENIKIKKFAISNPVARRDLEEILSFKKILHSSFEKTKNDMKADYSRVISRKIQQNLKQEGVIEPFYKIVALLFVMGGFLIVSIISFLYF